MTAMENIEEGIKLFLRKVMTQYLDGMTDNRPFTKHDIQSFNVLQKQRGNCAGLACEACYLMRKSITRTLCDSLEHEIGGEHRVLNKIEYRRLSRMLMVDITLEHNERSKRLCEV